MYTVNGLCDHGKTNCFMACRGFWAKSIWRKTLKDNDSWWFYDVHQNFMPKSCGIFRVAFYPHTHITQIVAKGWVVPEKSPYKFWWCRQRQPIRKPRTKQTDRVDFSGHHDIATIRIESGNFEGQLIEDSKMQSLVLLEILGTQTTYPP